MKKRKKSILILKNKVFWDIILGFVFIVSLFYLLFVSPAFKIKEVKIIAPKEILFEQLQDILAKEMQKKFLFITRNSFFLVWTREIETRVLEEIPQVKQAQLKKGFPSTLVLEVQKRTPVALYCREHSDCLLIDETGTIFQDSNQKETMSIRQDFIKIYSQESAFQQAGEKTMEEKEMEEILKIAKSIEDDSGLKAKEFTFEATGKLTLKTNEGWEIYFDLETDVELTLTKLHLLLKEELVQQKRKNLKYIDLRFSRAYYKYEED